MTTRVRIKLDFELDLPEDNTPLPSWLGLDLLEHGLNSLIDEGIAPSPLFIHPGAKIHLSLVNSRKGKKQNET